MNLLIFDIVIIILAIILGQIGYVEKGTSIVVIFIALIFLGWSLYKKFKNKCKVQRNRMRSSARPRSSPLRW